MSEPAAQVTFGGDPRRDEDLPIVVAIIVLGAIVAVPSAMALLGTINLDNGLGKVGGGLGGLIAFCYVVLGVGLMLRRELARTIYCVLAVIGLLLLGVGVLSEVVSPARARSDGAALRVGTADPHLIEREQAAAERQIAGIEANPKLTPAQKEQLLTSERATQEQLARELASALRARPEQASSGDEETGVGRFIPGILLTLIPLVFLLRPRVARLFA